MDEEDRERFGILLDDVVSIDIFIGDSSFYGLGIGTRVLNILVSIYFQNLIWSLRMYKVLMIVLLICV